MNSLGMRKGLTREQLAARVQWIYEKIANEKKLSHTEEQILAYHETAAGCRCKR